MYLNRAWQAIALKYRLAVAVGLAGMLFFLGYYACVVERPAGLRWQPEPLPPSAQTSLPRPLQAPALLPRGILWQSFEGLHYAAWDDDTARRYDWLQGTLQTWRVLPGVATQHLFWHSTAGDLWHARLGPAGEQQSAPFLLVNGDVARFDAVGLGDDRALVIWIEAGTGRLRARTLDARGRTPPPITLAPTVTRAALTRDTPPQVAWISDDALFLGALDPDTGTLRAAARRLGGVMIGVDELHLLRHASGMLGIVLGATRAGQPDLTDYQALIVAGESLTETTLPGAPHRWAHPTPSAEELGLAALQDGVWQPLRLRLTADGGWDATLITETAPVDGGPPHLTDTRLAWVTLTQTHPRLVHYRLRPPVAPEGWAALRSNLRQLPRGLLWLVAPALVAYGLRGRTYALAITLAVYWANGVVLGAWGAGFSPLDAWGVQALPGYGLVLALSSLAAATLAYAGRERVPLGIRHSTYLLMQTILTFAIFYGSVQ